MVAHEKLSLAVQGKRGRDDYCAENRIAVRGGSDGPALAATAESWTYREVKDPITDAARGMAMLEGQGGSLIIKCDKNGPDEMYIHLVAEKYLGGVRAARRAVIIRLDDGPLINQLWYHDGRSAALIDNKDVVRLTKLLVAAKKIVFRLTDSDGSNVDVLFASDGDAAVPRKAYATCGQAWPE